MQINGLKVKWSYQLMNSLIIENLLIKSPIIYCLLPTTNCSVLEFPASYYLLPTT